MPARPSTHSVEDGREVSVNADAASITRKLIDRHQPTSISGSSSALAPPRKRLARTKHRGQLVLRRGTKPGGAR